MTVLGNFFNTSFFLQTCKAHFTTVPFLFLLCLGAILWLFPLCKRIKKDLCSYSSWRKKPL